MKITSAERDMILAIRRTASNISEAIEAFSQTELSGHFTGVFSQSDYPDMFVGAIEYGFNYDGRKYQDGDNVLINLDGEIVGLASILDY